MSITGEVLNEPLEPSDAVGKWMSQGLLAAAYGGTALLLYLKVPAVGALVDNELLMLVLPAVLWGARWWFLNRVWPNDPRDSLRRDERR